MAKLWDEFRIYNNKATHDDEGEAEASHGGGGVSDSDSSSSSSSSSNDFAAAAPISIAPPIAYDIEEEDDADAPLVRR